jgi:biopolymer transport protein ExbD
MALRSYRHSANESTELNLIPIMNLVMIIIPLLLVTATFVVVNALNINSPRNAQSVTPEQQQEEEEIPVPRVLVAITDQGFTVTDMRQSPAFAESGLGQPLPECGGATAAMDPSQVPVTICNPANRASEEDLLNRLNFRGLYNRLVEIKNYSAWAAQWTQDNAIINIVADREVPFDVVVRTMDVARYLLASDTYDNDEAFNVAQYRSQGDQQGHYVDLFPAPVLLLPRVAAATN